MEMQRAPKRKALTSGEVQVAFEPLGEKYPPILSLMQASDLSGYTPSTLKKKLSEGCFRDSVSRGKPLRFWRDRFVLEVMNRAWSPRLPRSGQQVTFKTENTDPDEVENETT